MSSMTPDVHDRIMEAYMGDMHGEAFMRKTQRRIHWICAQAIGSKVLDIGCSQGVATILLAREGKELLAVDSDPKVIADARGYVAKEPEAVQKRITIIEADALTYDFKKKAFDTVLLTEVLEHLTQPASMVKVASESLRKGGRLVVTLPFGVNDFFDHKKTYYLGDALQLLHRDFDVEKIELIDSWVALTASLRDKPNELPIKIDLDTLKSLEAKFQTVERSLGDNLASVQRKVAAADKKVKEVADQLAAAKKATVAAEQSAAASEKAIQTKTAEVAAKQKLVDELQRTLSKVRSEFTELKIGNQEDAGTLLTLTHAVRGALGLISNFQARYPSNFGTGVTDPGAPSSDNLLVGVQHVLLELQATKQELQNASDATATRTAAFESERKNLAAEIQRAADELKAVRESSSKTIEQLSTQAEKLKSELDQALIEQKVQADALVAFKQSSQKALESQKRELHAAGEAAFDKLRSEIIAERAQWEQKASRFSTEIVTLREHLGTREADNQALQLTMSAAVAAGEALAKSLGEANAELKSEIGHLEKALHLGREQHVAEIELLSERNAQSESQVSEFLKRQSDLEAEIARLFTHAGDLTASGEAALQSAAALPDALRGLEEHLTHLQREIRIRDEEIRALRHGAQSVANERANGTGEVERLQNALEQARADSRRIEHNLKEEMRELRASAAQLATERQAEAQIAMQLGEEVAAWKGHAQRAEQAELSLKSSMPWLSAPFSLSEWPLAGETRKLRVAGIMDPFTVASYSPECDLLELRPENCIEQLQKFRPDLVFIESAWKGVDDLWQTKISQRSTELSQILAWCKASGIKSIFWNKEDPVHYSTFLPVAASVDVVFTTDIDCIPRYKDELGHQRVYLLPFAAQPAVHNPIEKFDRKDAFNFAGSYYLRYPERQRDFASIIETAQKFRPIEIHDRNFNNPHPHYTFPERYKPFIVGSLPVERIDEAYKGYRFGINMNTIKQSQTMFARRVYELLASNTIVISNFSKGCRLFFGDLIVCSDNAEQISKKISPIIDDPIVFGKYRLAGLRKVLSEHTYRHRLSYLCSQIFKAAPPVTLPSVLMLASVANADDLGRAVGSFERQRHSSKKLLVLAPFDPGEIGPGVTVTTSAAAFLEAFSKIADDIHFVGAFSSSDYYGPNYLGDLAGTSAYFHGDGFCKAAHFVSLNNTLVPVDLDISYRAVGELYLSAGLVRVSRVEGNMLLAAVEGTKTINGDFLAIDPFNYCRRAGDRATLDAVDDLAIANQGTAWSSIRAVSERTLTHYAVSSTNGDQYLPQQNGKQLFSMLPAKKAGQIATRVVENELHIISTLKPEQTQYIWSPKMLSREELNWIETSSVKIDMNSDFDVRIVFEFRDMDGQKLSHTMLQRGGVHALAIPEECVNVRFGVRFEGPGSAVIRKLTFGANALPPHAIVPQSRKLVIAKQYPSYDDLYRYGFLHSRVRRYREQGIFVDIFRITAEARAPFAEFEGIDVSSGSADLLENTLAGDPYDHLLIHLLDRKMWDIIKTKLDRLRVTIWVHGADIQVWERRALDLQGMTADEISRQKKLSDERVKLWREVFSNESENLNFVFVSNYLLNEAQKDLRIEIDPLRTKVIHNHIDGRIFKYQPKDANARKKVLSIRPYSSRVYANDLTVATILELSKRACFPALSFRLVGDGPLFEQVTAPLAAFANVKLDRRFLSHVEIASLHRSNGIFLVPTRMDSQGVSRDEAMSSGLVPVTNMVAAIPEFVDKQSGMIVPQDDPVALADAIEYLYNHPAVYLRLSDGAAKRVRRQSNYDETIRRELEEIILKQ